jgi:ADP-ribosylglycohydrolase
MERLLGEEDHAETAAAIQHAVELAQGESGAPADVERLGQGWEGHEALAIALYCALRARSFADGVLLAVNHGGDSDSTGAIAGNILGLVHGVDAIPERWLDQLELREVIDKVALELLQLAGKATTAWQLAEEAAGGNGDRG